MDKHTFPLVALCLSLGILLGLWRSPIKQGIHVEIYNWLGKAENARKGEKAQ